MPKLKNSHVSILGALVKNSSSTIVNKISWEMNEKLSVGCQSLLPQWPSSVMELQLPSSGGIRKDFTLGVSADVLYYLISAV